MLKLGLITIITVLGAISMATGSSWDCLPTKPLIGHWEITLSPTAVSEFTYLRNIAPNVNPTVVQLKNAKLQATDKGTEFTSDQISMDISSKKKMNCPEQFDAKSMSCAAAVLKKLISSDLGPKTQADLKQTPWVCIEQK